MRMHSTYVDTVEYRRREPQAAATGVAGSLSEITRGNIDAWLSSTHFHDRFPNPCAPVYCRRAGIFRPPFCPHDPSLALRGAWVLPAASAVITQAALADSTKSEFKLWDLHSQDGIVSLASCENAALVSMRPVPVVGGGGVLVADGGTLVLFSTTSTTTTDEYTRTRTPTTTSSAISPHSALTAAAIPSDGASSVSVLNTHGQLLVMTQQSTDDDGGTGTS